MATSGPATYSTRSFHGSRARAQRDRQDVQLEENNFGDTELVTRKLIIAKMKQIFLMKKVIVQAQVKTKVVEIHTKMMLMWLLMWLLMMTLGVLSQGVLS